MATRKTLEEMIADTKAKLKELEAKSKAKGKNKTTELTKDSDGMVALIAAIDAVATTHKITVPEVVKAVARIKRTGLIITNAVRKAKA
jgi:hypothetical protein